MPLGSESADLTHRGLAATRAAARSIGHNISSPGPPIAAPSIPVGGYSPGTAALDAALNFAAGAREAANVRQKIAAQRASQRHIELLNAREEQLLHPPTEDVEAPWGTERGLSPSVAASTRGEIWRHNNPIQPADPTVNDPRTGKPVSLRQFNADMAYERSQRSAARETRLTGQQKGLAVLRAQMSAVGEQQRQTDATASDVASKQSTAWQDNVMAEINSGRAGPFLASLGISGNVPSDISKRTQLLNLVEDHASRMRTDLERQFKTQFGSGIATKRAQLGQRLTTMGGVDFGDDDADQPSPMDDFLHRFSTEQ